MVCIAGADAAPGWSLSRGKMAQIRESAFTGGAPAGYRSAFKTHVAIGRSFWAQMPQFQDKVILVSGAETEIGRRIALETARRGARAVIALTGQAPVQDRLIDEIERAGAICLHGVFDGASGELEAALASVRELGRIDSLFNLAGLTSYGLPRPGPDESDEGAFFAAYERVVLAAHRLVRASKSLLEAAASPAAIVNIGSLSALTGEGASLADCAAQGALRTLTLALARTCAPRIRVNAILANIGPAADAARSPAAAVGAKPPLRTVQREVDLLEPALFLGSDAARHMTGAVLSVDGGLHLGSIALNER